jgi:hypothetical protein
MPFSVKRVKGGYKVKSPTHFLSKKALTKAMAQKQLTAVNISYRKK